MSFWGRRLTDTERAEELFSPYIDGQVTAEERKFLDRYLADHPEARAKFGMLKAAVQLTKTLPPVKAPRSFVLPRSMARKPGLALRLYPALRLATVAATALFVFALVGDLATTSRFAASREAQSVPLKAQPTGTAMATQAPAALAAEAPAPAITEAAASAVTPAPDLTVTGMAQAMAVTATLPAPTPAGAAQVAATVGAAGGTPEAMRAAAPTEGAPGELVPSDEQNRMAFESVESESPTPAPIDALRLAVIALAGLAVILAAMTLILRRRV